jgi:photosystem II stability/assembly factor-like uncharacterized protein
MFGHFASRWAAWLGSIAISTAVIVLLTVVSANADTATVLRWQLIGHIGDQRVQWVAVPPDGLASGVLFARIADEKGQNAATRRSRDGGKTWDAVPDPPGRIVLAPGGMLAWSFGGDSLYRSTDAGATWTSVAPVHGEELLFSPAFQQDGTVFLRGGGELWRSTDSGLTWSNLDPGQGQIVSVARLTPDFPADPTIFVGSVSDAPPGSTPTENADSLGLLISRDGGTTWSQASGLQLDDGLYQYVTDIAVSPNYGQDQTVFVAARGPKTAYRDTGNMESSAVFASGDGGATWALSNQSGSNASSLLVETLSLSPGFAADQIVQATGHRSGTAPSTFGCSTALSNDAGSSWTMLSVGQTPGLSSQTGVCGVGLLSVNGAAVVIGETFPYYLSGGYMQLLRSLDKGFGWMGLNPPGDNLFAGYGESSSAVATLPGALLEGTQRGDLWEYAALSPCAVQPSLGFGQVWSQRGDLKEASGCPLGPEQAVSVQVRRVQTGNSAYNVYWTGASNVPCFTVRDNGGVSSAPASTSKDCQGNADSTVSGSLLSFANGQYWLYIPDTAGHGFVVTTLSTSGVVQI